LTNVAKVHQRPASIIGTTIFAEHVAHFIDGRAN
jgi:hypothetical protein